MTTAEGALVRQWACLCHGECNWGGGYMSLLKYVHISINPLSFSFRGMLLTDSLLGLKGECVTELLHFVKVTLDTGPTCVCVRNCSSS